MKIQTIEDLGDNLCEYCFYTHYGECKGPIGYGTPEGYVSCEGNGCDNAYGYYLDSLGLTENTYKIAKNVKLINKEEIFENE